MSATRRVKRSGWWLAVLAAGAVAAGLFFYFKGLGGEGEAPAGATAGPVAADASEVHANALVLDSHVDVLLPETPARYYAPGGGSRASLEQLAEGGVDAVVLAIAVGPGPETPEGIAAAKKQAEDKVAAVRAFIDGSQGRVEQAFGADDIRRIREQGKVAVLLGLQNARILGEDLGRLMITTALACVWRHSTTLATTPFPTRRGLRVEKPLSATMACPRLASRPCSASTTLGC